MRIYKVGTVSGRMAYMATLNSRPYEGENYAFGGSYAEAVFNLMWKLGWV